MKEDFSEAYAVFACAYGDWTVTATVHNPVMSEVSPATYTQDRIVKFTATTIFRDETYVKESGNVTVEGSNSGGNFFSRLWNRIRDFFACIAAFFRNLFRR